MNCDSPHSTESISRFPCAAARAYPSSRLVLRAKLQILIEKFVIAGRATAFKADISMAVGPVSQVLTIGGPSFFSHIPPPSIAKSPQVISQFFPRREVHCSIGCLCKKAQGSFVRFELVKIQSVPTCTPDQRLRVIAEPKYHHRLSPSQMTAASRSTAHRASA